MTEEYFRGISHALQRIMTLLGVGISKSKVLESGIAFI